MFVRWKRKQRKDSRHSNVVPGRSYNPPIYKAEYLLQAVLVESVRIDGKPRQRTIMYLGSIRESKLDPENDSGIFHRGYFWRSVDANLDELNLPDSERMHIVAKLEETVPRPDPEERAEALRRVEQRMAWLSNQLGRA